MLLSASVLRLKFPSFDSTFCLAIRLVPTDATSFIHRLNVSDDAKSNNEELPAFIQSSVPSNSSALGLKKLPECEFAEVNVCHPVIVCTPVYPFSVPLFPYLLESRATVE